MNDKAIALQDQQDLIETVLIRGDLSKLTPEQRVNYYQKVCESLSLNALTRPFEYVTLNGKLVLYARRDAADQLRKRDGISVTGMEHNVVDDIYVVTVEVATKDGRTDRATGAVNIKGLAGEQKANAIMKAETKAKRRATLSICGLGFVDETEIDSIPDAKPVTVKDDGNIVEGAATEVKRMIKIWSGAEVDADAKIGEAAVKNKKFSDTFVAKFNTSREFGDHLKNHFLVSKASELTWEQVDALYRHLYNNEIIAPYYSDKPLPIVSGFDAMTAAKELYVAKGLVDLYNAINKEIATILGSIDGNVLLKELTKIVEAVDAKVFSNPPTDQDVSEIIEALGKQFKVKA